MHILIKEIGKAFEQGIMEVFLDQEAQQVEGCVAQPPPKGVMSVSDTQWMSTLA